MSLDKLIPAPKALQIVLDGSGPFSSELVSLEDAAGRVLASDLIALRTQPPFPASAMDGYAVRSDDVAKLPAQLNVIGESRAGVPFDEPITAGSAVRIFTGAVIPENADTIIIQENTEVVGTDVVIKTSTPIGKYIRPAGLDFSKGDVLLNSGDVLTPARLSLAASMNHANIEVHTKPKVSLISTGDELVLPGNQTGPGEIIASNTYGLMALCNDAGADVQNLGIAKDTADDLRAHLETAIKNNSDLIITMGGASVGDHDLVLPVAKSIGFEFEIAKIAMRPGKPFLFAKLNKNGKTIRLCGLAGNPVSSLVAAGVFVRPLIHSMAGFQPEKSNPIKAVLGADVPKNDERHEYMRATNRIGAGGEIIVTPYNRQDSSMLANLASADCLLIREIGAPAAHKGDECEFIPLKAFS